MTEEITITEAWSPVMGTFVSYGNSNMKISKDGRDWMDVNQETNTGRALQALVYTVLKYEQEKAKRRKIGFFRRLLGG